METRDSQPADEHHGGNGKIAQQALDLGADDNHRRPCCLRTPDNGWCGLDQDHLGACGDSVPGPTPSPRAEPKPPQPAPERGAPPEMPAIGSAWADVKHPDRLLLVTEVDPKSTLGRHVVGITSVHGMNQQPYACQMDVFLAVWKKSCYCGGAGTYTAYNCGEAFDANCPHCVGGVKVCACTRVSTRCVGGKA